MNGLRRVLEILTAFLIGFALSSTAALAADKQYTGTLSPSSGTGPVTVTATFTNQGNSAFNSLTLTPPAGSGYTLSGPLTTSRGNISIVNNSIQVININLPTGSGQVHTLSFVVNTGSCAAQGGAWTAVLWTGSGLTGQTFRQVQPSSMSTSYSSQCYTLTYIAGAGGTISGTTPQTVPSGGSGTLVTAVPSSGYRFVRWSDGSTSAARTDSNVTANQSYTATFAPALTFGTQPHDALAGGYVGPVTVTAPGLDGQTITLALLGGAGGTTLTGNTATMINGVATFNTVATASTTPAGPGYYLTASSTVADVQSVNSNTFTVNQNSGVLTCPTDPNPPSGSTTTFTDTSSFPLTGTRFGNKDASPCVAVPFKVTVESTPTLNKVTVVWDELSQPSLVLKLQVTWSPEVVNGVDLLPKPTVYDVGLGSYMVGTCLKKNPQAPSDPDNPPEQVGSLTTAIGASATSIPLTPGAAWPTVYPFPIIVPGSDPANPERMLVQGPEVNNPGSYIVTRGTGLTLASAHSAGSAVVWTPLPLDKGQGINAPAGGQDQVCSISDTYAAVPQDQCPAQAPNADPAPCVQPTQKLWAIGDLNFSW
jgi:List-Bact-rpt repeat protein